MFVEMLQALVASQGLYWRMMRSISASFCSKSTTKGCEGWLPFNDASVRRAISSSPVWVATCAIVKYSKQNEWAHHDLVDESLWAVDIFLCRFFDGAIGFFPLLLGKMSGSSSVQQNWTRLGLVHEFLEGVVGIVGLFATEGDVGPCSSELSQRGVLVHLRNKLFSWEKRLQNRIKILIKPWSGRSIATRIWTWRATASMWSVSWSVLSAFSYWPSWK